ncbi:PepSY domain-containing protein [Novilysobacter avium]|uniref:PepSY domain-containing protein n=1 Tax=Novilysobacter avium TaxID=2781023 RepID=A0A7S6UL45_9GAMM|nr:PepSY domain-containing protein [Lysobacter avium]QOW22332.1 PepSY domain-containing protein [Lysobacter avium]
MPSSTVLAAICLTLLAATTAVAGSAVAQTRDKAREPDRERVIRDEGRSGHSSASHRELSDAVRRVERRTGGQVLSAERVPYDGRDVSRVKIVDSSGRVRVYVDDPARGGNEPPSRGGPQSPSQRPVSTRRADN